jgi:hypothetical protein
MAKREKERMLRRVGRKRRRARRRTLETGMERIATCLLGASTGCYEAFSWSSLREELHCLTALRIA